MKKKTINYKRGEAAIYVGTTPAAMVEGKKAIMEILNATGAGDPAKVAAFETLRHFTAPRAVTIENCNFTGV